MLGLRDLYIAPSLSPFPTNSQNLPIIAKTIIEAVNSDILGDNLKIFDLVSERLLCSTSSDTS